MGRPRQPAYLDLSPAEIRDRADAAVAGLEECRACPRECGVNRLADQRSACKTGRRAVVASYFAHAGEEDCLRGRHGSGTIFFEHCNLRCVFCQNWDISQGVLPEPSTGVTPRELAAMMLRLQDLGCHNINLVTPEHVVPQVLEALVVAVEGGLRLPIVYNTSAYDALESLRLLAGVVDIYMPDFKFWSPDPARTYIRAADYPDTARAAVLEMQRQVGYLDVGADGLARKGVLLRHLVMPGWLPDTEAILRWVAEELGPETFVNLMDQYHPAGVVGPELHPELNRSLTHDEFRAAVSLARDLGLRLDERRG